MTSTVNPPRHRRRRTPATLVAAAALATVLTLAGCASSNDTDAGGKPSASSTPAGGAVGGSAGTGSAAGGAGQAGNAQGGRPTSTTATGVTASTAGGAATTPPPATTAAGPKTTRDPFNPITIPDESSCAPGPGDLPDGLYFGFLGAASADAFEFDLACWFSGEPANAAATADGEESPPPNDYYIRNTNETLRRVAASSTATVAWLPDLENPATTDIAYSRWVTERDFGQAYLPPVWVTVRNGAAIDIVEQWLP